LSVKGTAFCIKKRMTNLMKSKRVWWKIPQTGWFLFRGARNYKFKGSSIQGFVIPETHAIIY